MIQNVNACQVNIIFETTLKILESVNFEQTSFDRFSIQNSVQKITET